ncbi:MAG: hypothetical protein P3X22_004360 [Thermoprotei archaeon]|nr:hypothetical protein [Thermoprotei archaeon]
MRRAFTALILAAALVAFTLSSAVPSEGLKTVIAFDAGHRQSPKGLELLADMTRAYYRVLIVSTDEDLARIPNTTLALFNEVRKGGLNDFNLRDVDVLLIGQPEALPSPEEVEAIKRWFNQPNRALWIAGDSDYPAQGSEKAQQFMNMVLEALGSSIRIDYVSAEDLTENCGGAVYRVAGTVDPSPEVKFLAEGLQHYRVLFHGPGALYVISGGKPVNPVKQPELKPKNVYIVARTSENSRVVENQPAEKGGLPPVYYDPLDDKVNKGPFPLMLIEVFPNNRVIVASSETMYGGYQHMIITEYYRKPLDGPRFAQNLLTYLVSTVSQPIVVTQTLTQTITQTTTKVETKVETLTTTLTEQVGVSTSIAVIIAIIALIIGILAAYILRR